MSRYLPYINMREFDQKNKSATRKKDVFRAVAVLATQTIAHGEELYLDYFQDQRHEPSQIEYLPDWLIEPKPQPEPWLEKKEMVTHIPFLIKMLHGHEIASKGRKVEEAELKTVQELPDGVEKRKVGRIQQKLERQKQLD